MRGASVSHYRELARAQTSRNNPLRSAQNLATDRPVAHEGVICSQNLAVFAKYLHRPDRAAGLALDNVDSGPLGSSHPALRPIVEKYDHWIGVEALLRKLILDGPTVVLDRSAQRLKDTSVEMCEAGALARPDHPHPLLLCCSQVPDGKPLGDHRLAIGIWPDQHQPSGPQRRRSGQQLGKVFMRMDRKRLEPDAILAALRTL
jgi:hypothetical protein